MYKCFVAMKFAEPFDTLYTKGILPIAQVNFGEAQVTFPRADRNLKDLDFLKNVWANIQAADFVLADISPYGEMPYNPNVFYEVGYAKALGKPVIIISHGEEGRPPVNVTDCIKLPYQCENTADIEEVATHLTDILTPVIGQAIEIVQQQVRTQSEFYEVECFSNRTAADIPDMLASARREINILQTNLSTIRLNYADFIESAIEASREGNGHLRVRILTLDPDSYFTEFRANQITVGVAEYRRELHENLTAVLQQLSQYDEFELRIYDDFPNQIMFMADDAVYSCTVARSFRSRNLCTFKLHLKDMGVEKSFLFHFESLWAIAQPYTAK